MSQSCAYGADLALRDHLLHHLGHHIARVGICHRKDEVLLFREPFQLLRLLDGEAQRFLAHDVDARQQELLRHFVMQEVGGADGHEIELVRPLRFRRRHLFVVLIGALRGHAVRFCGVDVFGLHVGEASRNEFRPRVEGERLAVHFADEGVNGAAYHSVLDLSCHNFLRSERDAHLLAMASSNFTSDGAKSTFLTNAHASVPPAILSMPLSSHSTERGPS